MTKQDIVELGRLHPVRDGQTHWDGCERDHIGCALQIACARVAELEKRNGILTALLCTSEARVTELEAMIQRSLDNPSHHQAMDTLYKDWKALESERCLE